MANTYTLIASNTVGSGGVASVTFSSIPSTYTDLLIKTTTRGASGGVGYDNMSFNSSSSNFTIIQLQGNGANAFSASATSGRGGTYDASTDTASTFSSNDIYIPNYASSNYKSYSVDAVNETNATTTYATLIAGLWSSTAAITSISFSTSGSVNYVQYSTFYLYGIKNT
jgi:hypothetical protein